MKSKRYMCRYNETEECPFDDSDIGPPFAGTVKSCRHLNPNVHCPYYNEIKNADAIYMDTLEHMRENRKATLAMWVEKFFPR